jgi:hypothetical protein
MSHTVPSQHPAVVPRSNYQHLRTLLAIATVVIVGLTVAVVALATNSNPTTRAVPAAGRTVNHVAMSRFGTPQFGADQQAAFRADPAASAAIRANPSPETGARLDHRGLKTTVPHPAASSLARALLWWHTHEG